MAVTLYGWRHTDDSYLYCSSATLSAVSHCVRASYNTDPLWGSYNENNYTKQSRKQHNTNETQHNTLNTFSTEHNTTYHNITYYYLPTKKVNINKIYFRVKLFATIDHSNIKIKWFPCSTYIVRALGGREGVKSGILGQSPPQKFYVNVNVKCTEFKSSTLIDNKSFSSFSYFW